MTSSDVPKYMPTIYMFTLMEALATHTFFWIYRTSVQKLCKYWLVAKIHGSRALGMTFTVH